MGVKHFSTNCVRTLGAVVAAAGLAAGCGLDKQTAPSFIGPSGYGLSLSMSASPDILRRDGVSRSTITVTARDPQGEPLNGQRFLLQSSIGTGPGGNLSAEEVVTGSDGRARFEFVAPTEDVSTDEVTIIARAFGEDFANGREASVVVGLFGPADPVPSFTLSPSAPAPGQLARFDASATTVDGVACGSSCTYRWEFNDEATLEGQVVEYAFENDGFYNVALTAYSLKHNTQKKVTQRIKVGLP